MTKLDSVEHTMECWDCQLPIRVKDGEAFHSISEATDNHYRMRYYCDECWQKYCEAPDE